MKTRMFIMYFSFCILFSISSENVVLRESEQFPDVLKMSLEEKAFQVMMVNIPQSKNISSHIEKEFKMGIPGAILLFKQNLGATPRETLEYISQIKRKFSELAKKNKMVSVMPLIALDNEGGSVFRTSALTSHLPSARDIALKFKLSEAEDLFYIVAKQMKMIGIDFNLAPVAECGTKANESFLGGRTFSDSIDTTVGFANAFIRGMNKAGLLCSIKHFPGNGCDDPHSGISTLSCSQDEFDEFYIRPFKNILKESHPALAILLSHVRIPLIEDVPFCLSKSCVSDVVRRELKFESLILTDDIAMGALKKMASSSDNAISALEAGVDMIMCSERHIAPIIDAIVEKAKKDKAFEMRLNEAAFNVLRAKKSVLKINTNIAESLQFDEALFYQLRQKGDNLIKNKQ